MELRQVVSTSVARVGYETSNQTLLVEFRSGGVYEYYGINADLFEQMLRPYPWRRVGRQVKSHAYRRVA